MVDLEPVDGIVDVELDGRVGQVEEGGRELFELGGHGLEVLDEGALDGVGERLVVPEERGEGAAGVGDGGLGKLADEVEDGLVRAPRTCRSGRC